MNEILKWFSVCLLSGVKFVFGPTLGLAYQIPIWVTVFLTILGMMITVYLITYFGNQIRSFTVKFKKNQKRFTKRNRQFVKIWKKYGLKGVCLLTPLILTPPGGAFVANVFENDKKEILKWMWVSAISWSVVINLVVYYGYDWIKGFL